MAMETGHVPVLSTSRVIALCEQASVAALGCGLDDGSTSVAMRVHLDHLRPAAVESLVTAIATLERIEGRRYVFLVSALDADNEVIATGRIVRVVVDTDQFMDSAAGRRP